MRESLSTEQVLLIPFDTAARRWSVMGRNSEFVTRYYDAQKTENSVGERVYELLALVGLLTIIRGKGRDAIVADDFSTRLMPEKVIKDPDAQDLLVLMKATKHPGLKSRIGDALWCLGERKFHSQAREAVEAYLDFSRLDSPFKPEHDFERSEALIRALTLGQSLGKTNPQISVVLERLENLLLESDLHPSARLLVLESLLENKHGEALSHAYLAKSTAQQTERDALPFLSKQMWANAASWFRLAGEESEAHAAFVEEVEVMVRYAEQAVEREDYLAAAMNLRGPIDALRQLSGQEGRIKVLREQQRSYAQKGRKTVRPMVLTEDQAEIETILEQARAEVKGRDLSSALTSLLSVKGYMEQAKIEQQVSERLELRLLQDILPSVEMTDEGRISAREGKDKSLWKRNQFQEITRQVHLRYVVPMREQIVEDHAPRLNDLICFVRGNPLIVPGQEEGVLKGLKAALEGDDLTATHLLIPRLEASIRRVLCALGYQVVSLTSSGIQDVRAFNTLMEDEEARTLLGEIFGDDFIFELWTLLLTRPGPNLRNQLAHGLMSDAFFKGYQGITASHLAWQFYALTHIGLSRLEAALQKSTETMSDT